MPYLIQCIHVVDQMPY